MGEAMYATKAEAAGAGDVIESARRRIEGRLRALFAPLHGQGGAFAPRAQGGAAAPRVRDGASARLAQGQSMRDMPGEILREVFAQDLRDLSMRQAPLYRRRRAEPHPKTALLH